MLSRFSSFASLPGSCLLLFLLLLTGCKEETQSPRVRLRWITDANPARIKQLEAFHQLHPEIEVFVDQASTGSTAKILIQFAAHAGPDLVDLYTPEVMNYYAFHGVLMDITDLCQEAGIRVDLFWEQCRHWMEYHDRLYGIPSNCGTIVLFYNKNHFDEAGLAYPNENWSWSDYLEAARKLTKRSPDGRRIERYGCYPNEIRPFVWQAGGDFWNPELTRCTIDSPASIKGLGFFYHTRMTWRVAPSLGDEQSFSAGGWGGGVFGSPIPLFANGRVSMLDMGRWGVVTFRQYVKGQKDAGETPLRYGVCPLPHEATHATWFLSRSTAINRETRHPREAFEFARFMTSPEYNRVICEGGDGLPAVKALAQSDLFLHDPNYPEEDQNQVYLDDIQYGRVQMVPAYLKAAEFQKIHDASVGYLREGMKEPEVVGRDYARLVNEAIARNQKDESYTAYK
jgi:multiple sugar transport system substrate-binding protein